MLVKVGDYVLATKYQDGDPGDQYAVGFYAGMLPKIGGDRYLVVDNEGKQFRANGFRRCERIVSHEGRWLIARFDQFKPFVLTEEGVSGKSVWDWLEDARASHNTRDAPST